MADILQPFNELFIIIIYQFEVMYYGDGGGTVRLFRSTVNRKKIQTIINKCPCFSGIQSLTHKYATPYTVQPALTFTTDHQRRDHHEKQR
jgi:hypothetical protein